jgi:hypothetical protein
MSAPDLPASGPEAAPTTEESSSSANWGRPIPGHRPPTRKWTWVVVLVAVLVVLGGIGYYVGVYQPAHAAASGSSVNQSLEMGGFDDGQVVTFLYNGTTTSLCTPSLGVMFPNDPNASAATKYTQCEVGNANQTALPQSPQYILVPVFAGLSIFGVPALGANASGFPTLNGTALPTDCGAGETATACPDHPNYLYSPFFTAVERHLNLTAGYGGLPPGTLPVPAHDHLLNSPTNSPNIYWGAVNVLVLDPNIYPSQTSASCPVRAPSNLSAPTGNCLTSFAALERALTGCSSAAADYNSATHNPIWQTLVAMGVPGCSQVFIPGGINALDSNLYIPFSVSPGAPPMWPD